MTQIEKIKAEIERRMLEDYNSSDMLNDEIAQGVCAGILTFINSLPQEPVSKDLEKEIHNQAIKLHTAPTYEELRNFALHFVEWQKEQMLAKAVDGEVGYWNIRGLSINMELPSKLEEGDKVKLIIIKED